MSIGIASALAAGGTNILSTVLNNKAQKEMNQQNFDNQVRLWEMQNEYNSPKNQMKRFEEAGLNPNIIYGNGATTTAGPVGYTPGVASQSFLGGISDAFGNYMNYVGQRQERLLRKQAIDNAKVKDDATTKIAETEVGIKQKQLEQTELNNTLLRQEIVQNMDINSTKIKNEQEAHDLGMEIKKNEKDFNEKTRWLDWIIDKGTKIGDTVSKFFMPSFRYVKK